MRLTIVSLFCAAILIGGVDADTKECQEIKNKFLDCTTKAHETFKEQIGIGEDGRPDFAARKACNYMESAIQTCGSSLEGKCFTHAEIMKMKDGTTSSILKQLKSSLQEWDSNKCPAVESHIERLKQGGIKRCRRESFFRINRKPGEQQRAEGSGAKFERSRH